MAKYKPPSTPCRILRAIALLVQLKNKIRDKLWVSRIFTVPDDQKETETASTSNQQGFYDALTEPEVLISEADFAEPEVLISEADFAEPLIDFRLISEDGSSDGADCDMQDDDQSSLRRGWSAPVEMIDTGGSSDPRESVIQRGWSAPVEMIDTGGSSDLRESGIQRGWSAPVEMIDTGGSSDPPESVIQRGWSAPVEMIDTGGSSDLLESGIQRGWSAPVEMIDTGGSSDLRESGIQRGWSAPVEMIDTGGSSDPRESGIQRGWSAPVEMMDTGGSSDPRQSSISAVDWQKIMWLRQFLGLDVEVLPGREWTVVLRVVSAFKRMPWLMRSRRHVRAVVVAQNRAAAAPPMKRIKSAEVTKYKGIRRRNKKWVCEIRIAGTKEKVWLGSYNTDKEAALALDAGRHHCTLKKSRYIFASSPRLLGEPQRFEHLTCEEKKENIRKLAEKHAHEYAPIDIQ